MIQLNWLLLVILSMLIIQGFYISHKSHNTALQLHNLHSSSILKMDTGTCIFSCSTYSIDIGDTWRFLQQWHYMWHISHMQQKHVNNLSLWLCKRLFTPMQMSEGELGMYRAGRCECTIVQTHTHSQIYYNHTYLCRH